MPHIVTRNFNFFDTFKQDIRVDLLPAGGFWVVQCALTRVQIMRPNEAHHAGVGIVSAAMPNPPLFEAGPDRWHSTLFGKDITRIVVGIICTNCFITANVTAQRWD